MLVLDIMQKPVLVAEHSKMLFRFGNVYFLMAGWVIMILMINGIHLILQVLIKT